ncbi:MAG: RNA pyrophosphohydrolase [Holosporales bacterium]|jgi:putative (di)nucleoside polyphosphate hydrolase|nr:RNA pyrophosphohydrolase [Holosporales bacterium]
MSDLGFVAGYRPCVGMVVLNQAGNIFAAERTDIKNAWQMPQGGIAPGEEALTAAYRELFEETGMAEKDLVLIKQAKNVYTYDFPANVASLAFDGRYKGQAQRWFLFKFVGVESSINTNQPAREFSAWQWKTPDAILALAPDFKRDVYQEVFYDFCLKVR